ncbi:MAG: hypothetical protein LBC75_02275 [Fibromonadaceae bacterium]|jgi:hypothetical protein|nr:hypothetical protein [Fibromonadaceae bacterium]
MDTTDEVIEFLKNEGYGVFVIVENEVSNSIIITSGGSIKVVGLYEHTTVKTADTFGIENDKIVNLKYKTHSIQIPKFLIEVVKNYLPAPNASLENTKPSFSIMDFLNDSSTYIPKLAKLSRWEQDYLAIELLKYIKKNDKKDEPIVNFAKSIEDFLITINIITANSFYLVLFDNINSWGNHFHSKLHNTLELRAKTWKKLDLINTSKQGKIVFNSYMRNVVNAKFNELFNME